VKIAYFDCICGISGNMTLGAMIAAGLPAETLISELKKIHLHGWELKIENVTKKGISATHLDVIESHHHHHHHEEEDNKHHHHPHRGLYDIIKIIDDSHLHEDIKETAKKIFTRLGEAEADVHGTTPDKVHFHEVGAVDAIIDIVGTAIGLHHLEIDKVYASAIPTGNGWVNCAHGTLPIPAPATAYLLRGAQIAHTDIQGELTTPTGAAIVTTLAESFDNMPAMKIINIGYGAGTKEFDIPNVMRIFIGETTDDKTSDKIISLEFNLDDCTGEAIGYLMEKTLQTGALDIFYTPVQMKKNRPGVMVTVLCKEQNEHDIVRLLLQESTTLGIRRTEITRYILPRNIITVTTPLGEIRVKTSEYEGKVKYAPEYEDCKKIAESLKIPLIDVFNLAISQMIKND
jgi:uncharacterized protein (TIGR00299 family) protein